jgi:hypothetical protein
VFSQRESSCFTKQKNELHEQREGEFTEIEKQKVELLELGGVPGEGA